MKKAVWLLALGQTMLWCCLYYVFPATLLHWESAYGWSRSDLTLALTLAVGVSAIVAPFAGRIIDRGYGSIMMTMSATAGGILLYLISVADTLFSFYILWSIMGLAMAGCLYEPCFAFLVHCMKAGAKRAITLITLMAGFASTICFPSVHYLHEHFGIESTLQIFSICVIIVAGPLMFFGSRAVARDYLASSTASTSPTSTDKIESATHFLTSPLFWLLTCGLRIFDVSSNSWCGNKSPTPINE
ncbi:MFS transporter [Vibrio sp. CB1-14]|jgi:MFS family permease|uniref:MFS transporter n=1 Tax=Vibrio chaetopteri TaxID=3016528 RepID=A0AAU8BST4_9VIBR